MALQALRGLSKVPDHFAKSSNIREFMILSQCLRSICMSRISVIDVSRFNTRLKVPTNEKLWKERNREIIPSNGLLGT